MPSGNLVRGRNVDEARIERDRVHHEPFVVDRHADDPHSERRKQAPGGRVAGILDGHAITRLEEHSRHDVQRLLRAVRNDDVLGERAHAARCSEVAANGNSRRPRCPGGSP